MVLSDLPVHKEQAEGLARFFDRTSAPALADALRQAWQEQLSSAAAVAALPTSIADPVKRFSTTLSILFSARLARTSESLSLSVKISVITVSYNSAATIA